MLKNNFMPGDEVTYRGERRGNGHFPKAAWRGRVVCRSPHSDRLLLEFDTPVGPVRKYVKAQFVEKQGE